MNIYNWDSEEQKLIVTQNNDTKTLAEIQQVISLNKPQAVVDKFIELHLSTLDPSQLIADEWYEQQQLVETLDPDEPRKPIVDEEGNVTGEEPNAYDTALAKRDELELNNEWLKGYRGLVAPDRPSVKLTVDEFKTANASLFDMYNKKQGAMISGQQISLNETNQNGIAAVLTGLQLAEKAGANLYPFNFKAETANGDTMVTFANLAEFEAFSLEFMAARQTFFS